MEPVQQCGTTAQVPLPPLRGKLMGLALLLLLVLLALRLLPLDVLVQHIQAQAQAAGPTGWLLVVLGLALWNLILPPSPLQLVAAAAYGLWWGFAAAMLGTTLTTMVVYLLLHGRARRWVGSLGLRRPVVAALDRSLARGGARMLLLLRLGNLLPSSLSNLLCAAAPLSWWTVLWASALGKTPGVLLMAVLGQLAADLGAPADKPQVAQVWTWALLVLSVAASIVLALWALRLLRSELRPVGSKRSELPVAS